MSNNIANAINSVPQATLVGGVLGHIVCALALGWVVLRCGVYPATGGDHVLVGRSLASSLVFVSCRGLLEWTRDGHLKFRLRKGSV